MYPFHFCSDCFVPRVARGCWLLCSWMNWTIWALVSSCRKAHHVWKVGERAINRRNWALVVAFDFFLLSLPTANLGSSHEKCECTSTLITMYEWYGVYSSSRVAFSSSFSLQRTGTWCLFNFVFCCWFFVLSSYSCFCFVLFLFSVFWHGLDADVNDVLDADVVVLVPVVVLADDVVHGRRGSRASWRRSRRRRRTYTAMRSQWPPRASTSSRPSAARRTGGWAITNHWLLSVQQYLVQHTCKIGRLSLLFVLNVVKRTVIVMPQPISVWYWFSYLPVEAFFVPCRDHGLGFGKWAIWWCQQQRI